MSNELRKKLHDLAELSDNTTDPQTKAIVEAIRLQTAVLNERLFSIELQLGTLTRRMENTPESTTN
ncbi:hypothetical protein DBV14_15705 [Variovorax sp. KBW07]|uniref:hypothetical protein n=1 Tax=Variovorax sp. KBW07 TaxID=2153358 RepID=UPI000F56B8A9|nr:hypothetical protein [Variovorax sp. KBW07]RQO52810.1 hypothetical protein DBV14_15705 [Variovorax sp. KBW07]